MTYLADLTIRGTLLLSPDLAGRQLRLFMRLMSCSGPHGSDQAWHLSPTGCYDQYVKVPYGTTYGEALVRVAAEPALHARFASLPVRQSGNTTSGVSDFYATQAEMPKGANAEVPYALQDLADEVNEDITEACGVLDDPDLWYPGVDAGIEPVPDTLVEFIIAAMQRELSRETRQPERGGGPKLPAVQLASFPWRIQRAMVERRRLRAAQFGITPQDWEAGRYSLWTVPEDRDWTPRRREAS